MKSSSSEERKVTCCRLSAIARGSNICPFPQSSIDSKFGNLGKWIGCEISFDNDSMLYEVILVFHTRRRIQRLIKLCESLECPIDFSISDCPTHGMHQRVFVWDQFQDVENRTTGCLDVSWFGTLSGSDFNFLPRSDVLQHDAAGLPTNIQLDTTQEYFPESGIPRRTFDLLLTCQRARLELRKEEAKLADLEVVRSLIEDDEGSTMFSSCFEPFD